MQRQSLGSPVMKLHGYGGGKEDKVDEEEVKRKDGGVVVGGGGTVADGEENKAEKPHRSTTSWHEKSIHLIPILILFCLLVLYLCSYDPPNKILAHSNGFLLPSKPTVIKDSTEISDFGLFSKQERGHVLAIRSHRSLQEVGRQDRKTRFHRKMGDF